MIKNYLLSLLAILLWCAMILMFMCSIGKAAGQQCDWASDCGFNEKCKTVPFSQRSYGDKQGICVPKDW